jgi:hypothetical protein
VPGATSAVSQSSRRFAAAAMSYSEKARDGALYTRP